jgi:hypothetical protein
MVQTSADIRKRNAFLPAAAGAFVAFVAVTLLWVRYGSSVYAQSLLNNIIACF